MTYLLITVSCLCTAIICALIFGVGYYFGRKENKGTKPKTTDTSRQDREAKIKQQQMQNFWSYNGDQQQDPAEGAV